MDEIMKLCDLIRETGFAIHCYHRHGHLEKVYENALAHRLRKQGLNVHQQHPLKVRIKEIYPGPVGFMASVSLL